MMSELSFNIMLFLIKWHSVLPRLVAIPEARCCMTNTA